MATVERPGIDHKWLKSWKRDSANLIEWRDRHAQKSREALEYYAAHGEGLVKSNISLDDVIPPRKIWELSLDSDLGIYANAGLFELEMQGMDGVALDVNLALRVFAAALTREMVDIYIHTKFPIRLGGRYLQWMNYRHIPFTALGVIIGCREEAFRLARLQVVAYRRWFYTNRQSYPVFHFILRLLADYLNEPPIILEGESLVDPVFNVLFDVWRDPDENVLVQPCLAACDVHTYRCRTGRGSTFHEFDNRLFTRFPVEILLLFKLRQLLGLRNPVLDHPLMNTPLGVLPDEVAFCEIANGSDDLIKRVRDRMMQDGYDEEEIYVEGLRV